jgi:PEP-CTERM motif
MTVAQRDYDWASQKREFMCPAIIAQFGALQTIPEGIDGAGQVVGQSVVDGIGSPPSIPEPLTWAMTLMGFAGLGWLARLRRRKLTPA